MADRAAMLVELGQEIAACQRCALAATRTQAVPGEGPVGARIMFIGEGPGEQEDRSGRPFVGAAGQLLDQLLTRAGLHRPDIFITNIVKCRPPRNRDPQPGEAAACRLYLDAQIALLTPRLICLLGKPATHALLSPGASMGKVHGVPQEVEGIIYVPLYHPAAALHQPSLEAVLVQDMERLKSLLAATA
jgi:uracil-DNA glycosylase family 4